MRPGLGGFVLRCLLWLAPCYGLWLLVSPVLARMTAWPAYALVRFLYPALVSGLDIAGSVAAFTTTVVVSVASGERGVLIPDVDTRIYTYGFALFIALMLASRARWRDVAIGIAALLPVQAWGIGFDALAQLVRIGPDITARAGLAASADAIALAYQAGSLLFPVLAPAVLWVAFNRDLLRAAPMPVTASP